MSMFARVSDLFQQKANAAMDSAEDPSQALDFAAQKMTEQLQQARRAVADYLTAEEGLKIQRTNKQAELDKLNSQAAEAVRQGRDDLARTALGRVTSVQAEIGGLDTQIAAMDLQEQKLEAASSALATKISAFRTQKDTLKAQATAAQASVSVGEAVTGLSEHMADTTAMIDRAQSKITSMQARSMAIDQLSDSGALDSLSLGGSDDLDKALSAGVASSSVDLQLAALKANLALPAMQDNATIVRVQGEGQWRVSAADHDALMDLDAKVVAAVNASDETGFHTNIALAIALVKSKGIALLVTDLSPSGMILPSSEMTLAQAQAIMNPQTSAA